MFPLNMNEVTIMTNFYFYLDLQRNKCDYRTYFSSLFNEMNTQKEDINLQCFKIRILYFYEKPSRFQTSFGYQLLFISMIYLITLFINFT